MEARIEARGLRYAADRAEILRGVDVAAPGGEIGCVTGPWGLGKSTLLRALNRLIEPTVGEVYLDGVPTSALDALELRRRVGGMIFQLPTLFGATVEEDGLYGPCLLGRSADVRGLLEYGGAGPTGGTRRTLASL